jgi:hypothetical protein
MAGQPTVFDFAATIPIEGVVALAPPYAIISGAGTLSLRSYFHCGGRDRVERARVAAALVGGTVTYFLQNLQSTLPSQFIMFPGGAIGPLAAAAVQAEFLGAGDLVGSGLDPTDDYYLSATVGPVPIPPTATTETWRVLTILRGLAGSGVSAFDDRLVVQRIA